MINFTNVGFINFNKKYNKKFKNGTITVSFTSTVKNGEDDYDTQYHNAIIPNKILENNKELIKKSLNESVLLEISGVLSKNSNGYYQFTIFTLKEFKKQEKEEYLPF